MTCSQCKRTTDVFFEFHDYDVCEDCVAKAEAKYDDQKDWDYWHVGDGLVEKGCSSKQKRR